MMFNIGTLIHYTHTNSMYTLMVTYTYRYHENNHFVLYTVITSHNIKKCLIGACYDNNTFLFNKFSYTDANNR